MSPLSFLACPTRHTILLADIHSAVRRQLCPQIAKPEKKNKACKVQITLIRVNHVYYIKIQFYFLHLVITRPFQELKNKSRNNISLFPYLYYWKLEVRCTNSCMGGVCPACPNRGHQAKLAGGWGAMGGWLYSPTPNRGFGGWTGEKGGGWLRGETNWVPDQAGWLLQCGS